ncbi:MAG TPA: nucleoside triphosphate pyrophosphatase [Candidatus Binatia bacterium]|nr:nucleoside triphosphate pyrophosphatase [Candidatus Binatia bacterium]
MPSTIYLASASPRRRELLQQAGVRFEVIAAGVDESRAPHRTPAQHALALAEAKARAGAAAAPQPWPVLGADTDVVVDGEILGKPADRAHALALLARLSDRTHEVLSAVAVLSAGRIATALSVTRVTFGPVTADDAAAYWDTGEPRDKAGAYGIQGLGARFVKHIEGSYSGVMGLPLYETCELLRGAGVSTSHGAP